ncbi:MAG TPA: addiction module protein, partial [Blastocatellia bacterium]|nr:addiction module protein [Blastocatellia bacterium]
RTGRIINSLFLIEQQLLSIPVLYLSRYILERRADYNRLLLSVTRDEAWEAWVEFMLDAVKDTSRWTTNKIAAIRSLAEATAEYVKEKLPRVYSYELVSLIFELPYCRIGNVVDKGIAKRQTASVYLKQLTEIGVLVENNKLKEKLFINPRLMKLLADDSNTIEGFRTI